MLLETSGDGQSIHRQTESYPDLGAQNSGANLQLPIFWHMVAVQEAVLPKLNSVAIKYLYSAPETPTLGDKLHVLRMDLIFLFSFGIWKLK